MWSREILMHDTWNNSRVQLTPSERIDREADKEEIR